MLASLPRCRPRGLDAGLPALMMFAIVPRETSSRPVSASLLASGQSAGFDAWLCLPAAAQFAALLASANLPASVALSLCGGLLVSMPGFFACWPAGCLLVFC